jgi:arylamine N-acetyltransferase
MFRYLSRQHRALIALSASIATWLTDVGFARKLNVADRGTVLRAVSLMKP